MDNETAIIIELKNLMKKIEERIEDYEDTYKMGGPNSICDRISELYKVNEIIKNRIYEISPSNCD